jgi:adenylate kinase
LTTGPRIVILGKQGAGKGTQAARLARHLSVDHVATGDMFRAAARAGTPLGVEVKRYIDAGDLVPDDVTAGVLEERLSDPGLRRRGFVLDGFPRTRAQARELDRILADHPIAVVVNLEVPTEVVRERIAGRRSAEGRDDDSAQAITRRLDLYERETAPLTGLYRERGLLVEVDGVGEPNEVFERIVKAVEARLA